MRTRRAAAVLVAFAAGLTAVAAVRRRAGDRPPLSRPVTATALPATAPLLDRDAVVLPFARPAAAPAQHERPASPVRCGDSGGRTKSGAPCGARTTTGGRCHHHPMAA